MSQNGDGVLMVKCVGVGEAMCPVLVGTGWLDVSAKICGFNVSVVSSANLVKNWALAD